MLGATQPGRPPWVPDGRGDPSTLSSGRPSIRFRQSYCLLGQMGVPKAAAIRAEKAVRWSEMIGSSTAVDIKNLRLNPRCDCLT
uniref:Uncharacterized protein n=1 Tax=Ficus carica TaxID=3494 RepID=A0AA87YZV0_FICCA|nr:hypothetical protein TIFTF001_051577 [Ficus carica]GMN27269.1 hypothetical protein TIFTF001_051580 [Ficus carica]